MENASKALIMAGGMLLALLIVSLLIYAWSLFSKYQSSQDSLVEIEDTAKFNEQFTAYDRDNILGYEIISLSNKIADYNNRYSEADGAKNDKKYTPITLKVEISSLANQNKVKDKLTYDGTIRLFKSTNPYMQSKTKNEIENIISTGLGIEKLYGDVSDASKVAKNLSTLDYNYYITNKGYTEAQAKETVRKNFNSITGKNLISWSEVSTYLGNNLEKLYTYYEYYQFKKAIFASPTIEYDSVSGRVSIISIKWKGTLK